MDEKQIIIRVGSEKKGDLPSLQQVVFDDPHEALRAAQELISGASKALASGRENSANIRLLISGSASLSD